MDNNNHSKNKTKLIVQTIAIILFIAICTFLIMKLIDQESDSLSLLFIGFGTAVVLIVLLAVYIKYIVNIYYQISNSKQSRLEEFSTEENEKRHMKVVHNKITKTQKKKKNKKKAKK